jgi:hypothetical protein
MEENLAEEFITKLASTEDSGNILTQFYSRAFDFPFDGRMIGMFRKLIKMYGRYTVFFSLIDIYEMPDVNHQKIFGLIQYFCKKRLEGKSKVLNDSMMEELHTYERRIKEMKKEKLSVRSPFDE